MSILKTITVDNFYPKNVAMEIANTVFHLKYDDYEFGKQISNFNMINDNLSKTFSQVLKREVTINKEESGFLEYLNCLFILNLLIILMSGCLWWHFRRPHLIFLNIKVVPAQP